MLPYDRRLKSRSQKLRNEMTLAEQLLWAKLRGKKLKGLWFYRQKPIGIFIADFYCPKEKLVIEIDGGQHFLKEVKEYDRERTEYMRSIGLIIIRFTNQEVLRNIAGVIEVIKHKISA
jgi:very-short-patch-repair endonuclease